MRQTNQTFLSTYMYEIIATLLVVLVLLLKLFINNKATSIDVKKILVSIPGEITFLVLGFLMSDMISNASVVANECLIEIIIALILLVSHYAFERYVSDKLSGTIRWKIKIGIILMYLFSFAFYGFTVYGG